ncbi:MAG: signal peptidase I [Pseudomonadales bacterium]|jgi:signal peptidase I|nr:signal peptidase I [Pseudomonadales bacterium]
MNIDFSLVLVVLCAVSGLIWLADILWWRKPRQQQIQAFLTRNNTTLDTFKSYLGTLNDKGQPTPATATLKADAVTRAVFHQTLIFAREPALVEYAKSFFPILFGVLVLRSFLFEPFQIPSGSMIPTLKVGDFIVVNKYAYGLRLPVLGTKILPLGEPKRGDVMVFIPPHDPHYFIKRVIGLPGDHIQYKNKTIYVNGEPLPQEVVGPIAEEPGVVLSKETVNGLVHDIHTMPSRNFLPRVFDWLQPEGAIIPEGHYFMMGDNRDNSSDSREWGVAAEENIDGKAVAVWMHKEPGWNLPSFSQDRLIQNP